jgi:hypothetical protein
MEEKSMLGVDCRGKSFSVLAERNEDVSCWRHLGIINSRTSGVYTHHHHYFEDVALPVITCEDGCTKGPQKETVV